MAFSSGTIIALNGTVPVLTDGQSTVVFNVTGTWSATLALQATVDGTNWFTILGSNVATQAAVSTFSVNQAVLVSCSGYQQVQIIATAFTSGTVNVAWDSSNGGNNSILTASTVADRTGTISLASSGATGLIATNGCSSLVINVSGIGTNLLEVQGSVDGSTFNILTGLDFSGAATQFPNANGAFIFPCGGFQQVKISFVSYTSGTTTVTWAASIANNVIEVFNINSNSLAMQPYGSMTTLPQFTGATALSRFSFSAISSLRGEALLSTVPTYQISVVAATPAATPTDIVTISGSASKVIRVTRITLSSTQTTGGMNNWFIAKRSALNTAGTSSTPTITPSDSTNPAVTAVVKLYSANPTGLGALVGNVQAPKLFSPIPASTTQATPYVFDFTNDGVGQGVVLRNANELLALNFNGAALPVGLSISVGIEWQEF